MSRFSINFFHAENQTGINWHRVWIAGVLVIVVVGAGLTGIVAYGKTYDQLVAPRVLLNDVSLGGMTELALREYLNSMNDKLAREGVRLVAMIDGKEQVFHVASPIIEGETVVPFAMVDIEYEIVTLMQHKKHPNSFVQGLNILSNRLHAANWELTTTEMNTDFLSTAIETILAPYTREPQSAELKITAYPPEEPLDYTITTSSPGVTFTYPALEADLVTNWSRLTQPTIHAEASVAEPEVSEEELYAVTDELPLIFGKGPIVLTYVDSHTKEKFTWKISEKQLGTWIDVIRDSSNQFTVTLNASTTDGYLLDEVEAEIGVEPQDAKFDIGANGKVVEFKGSRPGVGVDREVMVSAIQTAFETRKMTSSSESNTPIEVVVKEVQPNISTDDVNDLGIKEILGTGTSNFSGSPVNRIANIKNAAYSKLHGTLIKPGEEFSLNNALRPYTTDNGYLYEKVIVGNRITKEVGGGLCQIGTTMFRAAMNSGLPITARTNHGLVVSYYNDPSNGNPGTDATIYDGWPDFKFVNDTGNYVLITTYMDTKTSKLQFTFWGTGDGREGYYTPPKVSKWVSPGPYQEFVTTDLPPGVKECQSAYKGADTSFTYVRVLPNGEKKEEVFTSHYRAVPAMCFVGKTETVNSPCPEGETCSNPDGFGETSVVEGESTPPTSPSPSELPTTPVTQAPVETTPEPEPSQESKPVNT